MTDDDEMPVAEGVAAMDGTPDNPTMAEATRIVERCFGLVPRKPIVAVPQEVYRQRMEVRFARMDLGPGQAVN